MKLVWPMSIGFSELSVQLERNASAVVKPAATRPAGTQIASADEREHDLAPAFVHPLATATAAVQEQRQLGLGPLSRRAHV